MCASYINLADIYHTHGNHKFHFCFLILTSLKVPAWASTEPQNTPVHPSRCGHTSTWTLQGPGRAKIWQPPYSSTPYTGPCDYGFVWCTLKISTLNCAKSPHLVQNCLILQFSPNENDSYFQTAVFYWQRSQGYSTRKHVLTSEFPKIMIKWHKHVVFLCCAYWWWFSKICCDVKSNLRK